ncbi:MAG: hypothetical protein ACPHV3_05845 [Vibrio sp.]
MLQPQSLFIFSAILGAAVLGFILPDYFTQPQQINAEQNQINSQPIPHINLADYCQLSTTPCQQNDATLVLSADKAHALKPVTLTVDWPNPDAKVLTLKLQGLEMDLGETKYVLHALANGQFQTTIVLPFCSEKLMTWYGELHDEANTIQVKTALIMSH